MVMKNSPSKNDFKGFPRYQELAPYKCIKVVNIQSSTFVSNTLNNPIQALT
jgi:hypothetical protein